MDNFNLKGYLAENRLLKEEIDVNKILSDGGYDIIDDEELLMTVKSRLKGKSNIDAEKLNLLVMKIEDEEGGNIDFTENKLLKEVTFADVKAAAEKKPGYEGEEGEDGFSIPYEFGTINMYNRPLGGDGTGDVGIEYESGGTTQETGFISYGKAKRIVQKSLAEGRLLKEDFPNQKYYDLLNDLRDAGLLNKSGVSGLQSKFNLSKEKAKEIFDEYLEDLKAEQPDAFDFFMKDLNEDNSLNEQYRGMVRAKVEAGVNGLTEKIKSTVNSEKSAQEMSEIFKSATFRMGQLLESYATYIQHIQQSNNSDDSLKKIADAEDDLDISFKKIGGDIGMDLINFRLES